MYTDIRLFLDSIKKEKGISHFEVANTIGYTREHLSREAKKGNNIKLMALLKAHYPDVIPPTTIKTTPEAAFSNLHSEIIRMKAENTARTMHMVKCFEKLGIGSAAVQLAEMAEVASQLQKLELDKLGK